ncbi:MAG: hypothetical protein LBV07_06820 [Syntrophobacterales bacterium]|nr:hypothetical protein [Syntrophobacterales bacterium]
MKFMEMSGDYAEMGFLFWIFTQYMILWIYPSTDDAEKIFFLALLMGFEFFMLGARIMFAGAPFIAADQGINAWWIFAGCLAFFGLFAFVFVIMAGNVYLIWIYAGLVISRLFQTFQYYNAGVSSGSMEATTLMGPSALQMMLFFFIMMIVVFQHKHVPTLALTQDFLQSINYEKAVRIKGMLTEMPHVSMCFGALYYGLLFAGKFTKTIWRAFA